MPGTHALRLVERRSLRVADVALFYGERSGGIRTYLDAKVEHAVRTGAFEHHLIVPGARAARREHAAGVVHELPSVRVGASNGYRWPLGSRRVTTLLGELRPDVLLLHDPFWAPRARARCVLMVHHGSVALDAAAFRGPQRLYAAGFRAWLRRSYAHADGVMAACDPQADTGRDATLRLRFGLDPAFRPRAGVRTVACSNAPSARLLGDLVRTFQPGDVDGLAAAIGAARASEPDLDDALMFAAHHQWDDAFKAELADLERLVGAAP